MKYKTTYCDEVPPLEVAITGRAALHFHRVRMSSSPVLLSFVSSVDSRGLRFPIDLPGHELMEFPP